MAGDGVGVSLGTSYLSNPKAGFNLAGNYKYRIQQVKGQLKTPTKNQDGFIYCIKRF